MLTEPLPATLDVRKAAARKATVKGTLELRRMPRLLASLASDSGSVEAECAFARDEEGRCVVSVSVDAQVEVQCQRCLETMAVEVHAAHQVGVVGSDDQVRQLPSHLEPWLVEREPADLWALVEDELILGLPMVSYHDSDQCRKLLDRYRSPPERATRRPFEALKQLKSL